MIRIVILGLALASCAPAPSNSVPPGSTPTASTPTSAPTSAAPRVPESITYETFPCYGMCPVYRVTVSSDGKGSFTGSHFTSVTGERAFTITPAEYDAFAAVLAPHLPDSGNVSYQAGEPNCPDAPTDMPGSRVIRTRGGKTSGIDFYYGCKGSNEKIAEALDRAPGLLPIAGFIAKH